MTSIFTILTITTMQSLITGHYDQHPLITTSGLKLPGGESHQFGSGIDGHLCPLSSTTETLLVSRGLCSNWLGSIQLHLLQNLAYNISRICSDLTQQSLVTSHQLTPQPPPRSPERPALL